MLVGLLLMREWGKGVGGVPMDPSKRLKHSPNPRRKERLISSMEKGDGVNRKE